MLAEFIYVCILTLSNGSSGNAITTIETVSAQDCNEIGYNWKMGLNKSTSQPDYSSYVCVKIRKVK